jgi:hypothetical protein
MADSHGIVGGFETVSIGPDAELSGPVETIERRLPVRTLWRKAEKRRKGGRTQPMRAAILPFSASPQGKRKVSKERQLRRMGRGGGRMLVTRLAAWNGDEGAAEPGIDRAIR